MPSARLVNATGSTQAQNEFLPVIAILGISRSRDLHMYDSGTWGGSMGQGGIRAIPVGDDVNWLHRES